ncbi:Peptide upstream ORF protein [Rhynchospora pubera]|uniref:Peptide upstream ORF protein n=1 Tax=Rhynchospora pubera TaxID=906938 RepID=A0AAV8FQN8_9POAL|nr:Peptide upstream ORF protein [Rhynchospora pubera]KAJ4793731.1 Peptide upstream ORF protein [Rhynchospora pubera]
MTSSSIAIATKLGENRIMSSFSAERIVRFVARTALITMILLSFPLLHSIIFSRSGVDNSLELQMLLNDLRQDGLFNSDDRAVFLGDSLSLLPFLKKNNLIPLSRKWELIVPDHSVDFIVAADGFGDDSFGFIDRILRTQGIAVFQLSSEPVKLPGNYRTVFMKKFESTAIAVKKIAQSAPGSATERATSRRLLAVPEVKKQTLDELDNVVFEAPIESPKTEVPEVKKQTLDELDNVVFEAPIESPKTEVPEVKKQTLDELEDVLLEPPIKSRKTKNSKRIKFLPMLIGDSLENYPRRVFIDVGPPKRADSKCWFKKNYPKGKLDFEMVRLDVGGSEEKVPGESAQGMSDWLRVNVKKEDYVVMKAEAGAVEEMLQGKAIGLVDELFLECKNQWFKGKKSKRAYWECLALYGRLRDEGVAVHQWWG